MKFGLFQPVTFSLFLCLLNPEVSRAAFGCLEKDGFSTVTSPSVSFGMNGSQLIAKGRVPAAVAKRPRSIRLLLSSDPWLNLPEKVSDVNQNNLKIQTFPLKGLSISSTGDFTLPPINIDSKTTYYGFLQAVGCEQSEFFEIPYVPLNGPGGRSELIESPTESSIRGELITIGQQNLYAIRIPANVAPVSDPVFVSIDGVEYSSKNVVSIDAGVMSALNGTPSFVKVGDELCLLGSGTQVPGEIILKRKFLVFFRKAVGGLLLSPRSLENIDFISKNIADRHPEYLPSETRLVRNLSAVFIASLYGKSIDGGADFTIFDRIAAQNIVGITNLVTLIGNYNLGGVARGIQFEQTGGAKLSAFSDAFVKLPISIVLRGGKISPQSVDISNIPTSFAATWTGQVSVFEKTLSFSKIANGVICNTPSGATLEERTCKLSSADLSNMYSNGWWIQVELNPNCDRTNSCPQPGPFSFSIESSNNGKKSNLAFKGSVTTDPLLLRRTRKLSFKSSPAGKIMESKDIFDADHRDIWIAKGYNFLFKLGAEYSKYKLTNVQCNSVTCPPSGSGNIEIGIASSGEVNVEYPSTANDNLQEFIAEFELTDPSISDDAENIIIAKRIKPFNGSHIVVSGYSNAGDPMGKYAKAYATRYVDELIERGILAERISGFDFPLRIVDPSAINPILRNGISLGEIESIARGTISGLTYFGHSFNYISTGVPFDARGGPMLGKSIDAVSFAETFETIPKTKPIGSTLYFAPDAILASYACNSAKPIEIDKIGIIEFGWHEEFTKSWRVDAAGALGWTWYTACRGSSDLSCFPLNAGIPGILTTTPNIKTRPNPKDGTVKSELVVLSDGLYYKNLKNLGFPRMELSYVTLNGDVKARVYLPDEFIQPKILAR